MRDWSEFGIEIPHGVTGPEVYTTCPQCSPQRKKKKAKCLGANLDEGVWVCHHCGWSGTLKHGSHKPERLHWQPPKRKPKPIEPAAESEAHARVVAWFQERGISRATLDGNGVSSGEVYMPQVEGWVNAVSFPYYRDGDLVNRKWRDGRKNFRLEAGCERVPFGLDDMTETVIWVEGEIDKLSLYECGYTNAVSVPDGAPAPDAKDYSSKFDFLDNIDLSGVQRHVIAVDDDEPGRVLEDELARRLGKELCYRLRWPEDCKDANETLCHYGEPMVSYCIGAAQEYPVSGIYRVADVSSGLEAMYQHGLKPGLGTGWPNLDEYYTVQPGEITLVTGIPNSGKSNFVDALTMNISHRHDWRIGVFSPENRPIEQHVTLFAEKYANIDKDSMPREDWNQATRWLGERFFWMLPESPTLDTLLEKAKTLVYRHGVRGIILDPWNELEHSRHKDQTESEYIGESLRKIRQFADRHGIHVWIVGHPTKLQKDKDGRYPVPTPYDVSGSANWRNKPDNCLALYRDFEVDAPVEVYIQKVRFRHNGKPGMAKLKFDKRSGNYGVHHGP